jgi:hypothetical protein
MDGGRRHAMYLFEYACKEAERVSDEDGAAWYMQSFEALVCRPQSRADGAQDETHTAQRMPQVGMLGEPIEFFDRHRLLEDQSGFLRHLAERAGGEHDDFVAS